MKLTAIFEPGAKGGFVCRLQELPGVQSQGDWQNPRTSPWTAVPCHREVREHLARHICLQLGILLPWGGSARGGGRNAAALGRSGRMGLVA
jgi:hypothetical protein